MFQQPDSMPDSPSPQHQHSTSGRKGSRKVRTGCITCKVRKVKCDEAKPFCVRCMKSGRQCDGYLDPSVMASRRKSNRDGRALSVGGSPYSSFSTLLEWAVPEEKRAFHFFQQVTAPHLAGDLDAVFWKVLVLQVCQAEPAVRHAVLAVSSMHESLTQGDGPAAISPSSSPHLDPASPGTKASFALQQYNKAIACLLDRMKDTTSRPLAPLLTCVLFVCLEFMHGKDKESLIHLEQGRQILSKLDRKAASRDPEIDIVKLHLVPIYLRLSLTSFLFGGRPVPIPQGLKTLPDVPTMFESVHEIRFVLYDFMDEVLRFMQRARQARYGNDVLAETFAALSEEQDSLKKRLAKFGVAFSLYQVVRPAHMSDVSSAVFQMYLHTMNIWVATSLSNAEACFDDHLSSFSAIIPLAALILNKPEAFSTMGRARAGQQQPGEPTDSRAIFTFETYVIPILYYVATKCRHPLIRHSALDLLKQNPQRRENLWQASRMAAIAEHIVKVEEESVGDDASNPPFHPTMLMSPPYDASPEQNQQQSVFGSYHNLPPSIEPLGGQHSAARTAVGTANDDAFRRSNESSHLDLGDGSLLGLEELGLGLPIDPSLMMDVEVAGTEVNFNAPGSFRPQQHRQQHDAAVTAALVAAVTSSTDMSGFLAPSPLPQPSLMHPGSGQRSRASSVASHINVSGEWGRPSSAVSGGSDGSYGSDSHSDTHVMMQVASTLAHGFSSHYSPEFDHQFQQQQQQQQQQQPPQQQQQPNFLGQHNYGQPNTPAFPAQVPTHRPGSMEAPFDIPEHIRVHDVIISPEKADGSWLTVFRRLRGPAQDWDVHTEFISLMAH
ncbi:hypothetical protein RB595_009205 [Gaeumannomyces hyphopodioides]